MCFRDSVFNNIRLITIWFSQIFLCSDILNKLKTSALRWLLLNTCCIECKLWRKKGSWIRGYAVNGDAWREAWGIRQVERYKFNIMDMKFPKSMCSVTRMERVRNDEVRCRVGVWVDMSDEVVRKILKWFRHVEPMSESWNTKRMNETEEKVKGMWAGLARRAWTQPKRRALRGHWSWEMRK